MNQAVQDMIKKYNCQNTHDYRQALKEIIQEIALLGLSRSDFFNSAAFYGGTALRIFHGLDRFSEDLDFSLTIPNSAFELESYFSYIQSELGSYGFEMHIDKKIKSVQTDIQSAFIKGGTLIHMIHIASVLPPISGVSSDEQLKIKVEIDTNPPIGATFEMRYQLLPVSFAIQLYDLPSLFAGKMHAFIARSWKHRVKGRDFYDVLWYLARDVSLNLIHLEARLRQSNHWTHAQPMTRASLLEILDWKLNDVNMDLAKRDASSFVKDVHSLSLWSPDFFNKVFHERLKVQA